MNKAQIVKCLNMRVRLRPVPLAAGMPHDDEWLVQQITDSTIQLSNPGPGYIVHLGLDHIREFISDPGRSVGTVPRGFLKLKVQLTMSGRDVIVEPV